MKQNEKKLIALASVVFVILVIVQGIPFLRNAYQENQAEIEFLEQRIERLQMLMAEAPQIKQEEARKRRLTTEMEYWTFSGQEQNLVGSSVQRQLRQAVEEAGVQPRSYDPPRYSEIEGWLLVTQEMDFVIDQENILKFLDLIAASRPKLHVTEFNINRNRRQFLGSITVTGFSKSQ